MAVTKEQGRYIERMFKDMQKVLHSYAVSILKNDFQAEEAVQETFCVVCQKPEDMMTSPNPSGWVMKTLKNELKNAERKTATLRKYFITANDIDMKWMRDPLCQLDDDVDLMYADLIHREDFYLLKQVILEKRTLLDMAKELGISVEACKKRFQRAKEKFRQEIAKIDKIGVP